MKQEMISENGSSHLKPCEEQMQSTCIVWDQGRQLLYTCFLISLLFSNPGQKNLADKKALTEKIWHQLASQFVFLA